MSYKTRNFFVFFSLFESQTGFTDIKYFDKNIWNISKQTYRYTNTSHLPHCRFDINFCYDNDWEGENAFHFNPRFDEHEVYRNTLTGGRWGREEVDGPFPFSPGQHFQVVIICLHNKYKVSFLRIFGGLHSCWRNMMTSSNGNIFRVTGPLCVEFTGPGEFPSQMPVTRSFDVFFDLRLNKRLSKQPRGWWFEALSWSLWRHCNVQEIIFLDLLRKW